MNRSIAPTISVPQRLAACALVVAGALCLFATGEGLRLRSAAIEQLAGATSGDAGSSQVTPSSAQAALERARANLARANEAFARSDADQAAQFALSAQDDLRVARAAVDGDGDGDDSGDGLNGDIEVVESGLQALRQQGLSRERARRGAPPVFDFFRGFPDWGNPDIAPDSAPDSAPDEDTDSSPSAHPLGPAQPLTHGRHIMASWKSPVLERSSRVEIRRA